MDGRAISHLRPQRAQIRLPCPQAGRARWKMMERMQIFHQQGIRNFTIIYCEACPLHLTGRIFARDTRDAPWITTLRPRWCDRIGKPTVPEALAQQEAARETAGLISCWAHKRHSLQTPDERWLFHWPSQVVKPACLQSYQAAGREPTQIP